MLKLLLLVALLASIAQSLPTISVKGSKFFAGGQQFFLKGVAYQGTPEDPLVDTAQCTLEAESMANIGTNSIRVYHVNPWANHDGCMSVFAQKGIYVWLDLDTFNTTILQNAPTWTNVQFWEFARVMDAFQQYDNLGGFWIGNEFITSLDGSGAAPFIKAAVADLKAYRAAKNYRAVPIGYSAADIAELRPQVQNYLACGSPDIAIDFFGLNSYEWCGDVTYETSGYSILQKMTQGYSIPIFFSETGCNVVPGGRKFTDQAEIFGPNMIDTWSGSIIYEWVQEANMYGLVTYPNGKIYSGAPIPIQPDYDNIKNEWSQISPAGVKEADYKPSLSAPACPLASGGWKVNGDVPLPTLGAGIVNSAAEKDIFSAPPPTTTILSMPSTSLRVTTSLLFTHGSDSVSSPSVEETSAFLSSSTHSSTTTEEASVTSSSTLAMLTSVALTSISISTGSTKSIDQSSTALFNFLILDSPKTSAVPTTISTLPPIILSSTISYFHTPLSTATTPLSNIAIETSQSTYTTSTSTSSTRTVTGSPTTTPRPDAGSRFGTPMVLAGVLAAGVVIFG